MTRTDHRDAGTRKDFNTSAHAEHYRWVIDFLQARWVRGLVERNNFCAALDGFGHFLLRKFDGLAGCQRLRRNDRHSGCFQFREAGVEHPFRAAEMLHQLSHTRGAQAGRQREG